MKQLNGGEFPEDLEPQYVSWLLGQLLQRSEPDHECFHDLRDAALAEKSLSRYLDQSGLGALLDSTETPEEFDSVLREHFSHKRKSIAAGDTEYLVVSDTTSEVLLSTTNYRAASRYIKEARAGGEEVTLFKTHEI